MSKWTVVGIIVVVYGVGAGLYQLFSEESSLVARVHSGEAELFCHMSNGLQRIDPALIIGHDDRGWLFTNGSASNCTISERTPQ